MAGTWGSFAPLRWICWRPFGGIGPKAAATTSRERAQPNFGEGLWPTRQLRHSDASGST